MLNGDVHSCEVCGFNKFGRERFEYFKVAICVTHLILRIGTNKLSLCGVLACFPGAEKPWFSAAYAPKTPCRVPVIRVSI